MGKLNFTMYDSISYMLEYLPEYIKTEEASTPSGDHVFTTIEDNTEKLSKEEAITFHHVTAKLLYLAKRARPDLKLGVAFLCTRLKDPENDD